MQTGSGDKLESGGAAATARSAAKPGTCAQAVLRLLSGTGGQRVVLPKHRVAIGGAAGANAAGALEEVLKQIDRCAPLANALTKAVVMKVGSEPLSSVLDFAADRFAEARRSPEAAEGLRAFAKVIAQQSHDLHMIFQL